MNIAKLVTAVCFGFASIFAGETSAQENPYDREFVIENNASQTGQGTSNGNVYTLPEGGASPEYNQDAQVDESQNINSSVDKTTVITESDGNENTQQEWTIQEQVSAKGKGPNKDTWSFNRTTQSNFKNRVDEDGNPVDEPTFRRSLNSGAGTTTTAPDEEGSVTFGAQQMIEHTQGQERRQTTILHQGEVEAENASSGVSLYTEDKGGSPFRTERTEESTYGKTEVNNPTQNASGGFSINREVETVERNENGQETVTTRQESASGSLDTDIEGNGSAGSKVEYNQGDVNIRSQTSVGPSEDGSPSSVDNTVRIRTLERTNSESNEYDE